MLGLRDLQMAYRLWSLYGEVKGMDSKALIKVLVVALLAAGTAAGTPFLTDEPITISAVLTSCLTAVVGFLSKSPLVKA